MELKVKTTVNAMVKDMIKNATTLEMVTPEPTSNRFRTRTFIFCVDKIPEHYNTELINTLYFVNDRHGYFISNKENVVNLSKYIDDWDTGIDSYINTSKENMGTVGTRLLLNIDGDIQVHKIIGFKRENGSIDTYFDIK